MSARQPSLYSSHYERMSGNCTRMVASQIIAQMFPPITTSSYILDNACGPGIVTEQIKLLHSDAKVMAADISPGMLNEVKERSKAEGWNNIETALLDARQLTVFTDKSFSHVITNFGMPVPGDSEGALKIVKESFRVLQTGGVAIFSTWADRVWLNAFYEAGREVRPNEAPQTIMALKPEEMRGSWLAAQLEEGGFGNNVEVRPCITYTTATSLEELVDNMMLASTMFFKGYDEYELIKAKMAFKEALQKLRTFEVVDGGVRIGMKAWLGIGRKIGDETEVPV